MGRVYAALAVAVTAAFVGVPAWYYYQNRASDPFADCRGGAVGGGAIGGPLSLVDGAGKAVTEKDIFTKPTLLYFGYTFCPDVCPMDNARNAEAVDILEERGYEVTPVFISIDPTRDTPEVVSEFAANLHPRMIGLTGSPEQVKAASLAYKTYFKKQDGGDPEFYLMDHSTYTYLVLPGSGFVDFFGRDTSAEDMADRVGCFLQGDATKTTN